MKLPELNFQGVRTTDLDGRHSKVKVGDFAKPLPSKGSLADFFQGLPNILAAADLHEAAERIAAAKRAGRPVTARPPSPGRAPGRAWTRRRPG